MKEYEEVEYETMFAVMFVEQRKSLIQTYKQMLNWESNGFHIASITDNEQQAVSYYGEYHHDLIIIDIDLKSKNGLSLIKKLKKLDENCSIVVLSEHEDFVMMRKLFRLGILDYLLKKEVRVATFISVFQQIKLLNKNSDLSEDWNYKMSHLLGLLCDHQEIDPYAFDDLLKEMNFDLLLYPHRIIYFRMDNVRQINRNLKIFDQLAWDQEEEEDINLYAERVKQRDTMQKQLESSIRQVMNSHTYLLLFAKKHSGFIILPEHDKPSISDQIVELKERFKSLTHCEFSFTKSIVYMGKENFITNLIAILEAHKNRFYIGDNTCIDMEKTFVFHHLKEGELPYEKGLLRAAQNLDGEECIQIAQRILAYMQMNMIFPEEVIRYFLDLMVPLESVLTNKGYPDLHLQKEAIFESETFAFLSFEVDRIFKTLRDDLAKSKNKNREKLQRMLTYIDLHLGDNLKVDIIAKEGGLHPAYATRLMKKEMGITMIQLILQK